MARGATGGLVMRYGAMKHQPDQEDRLMTVQEIAEKLRISASGVRNLIAQGKLPHINLACGRKLIPRIRRSDMEEFIQGRLCAGVKR